MPTTTQDPEALRKSMDRAQACANAYIWLLKAIPNPNESLAFAEKAALESLMNDWRGDWSLYHSYDEEIVPFEANFAKRRAFYAASGADLSKVPAIILQDNRMLKPRYVGDSEFKAMSAAEKPPEPIRQEQNAGMSANMLMLTLGAGAAAILGFFMLRKRGGGLGRFRGSPTEHEMEVRDMLKTFHKAVDEGDLRRALRIYDMMAVPSIWMKPRGTDTTKRYLEAKRIADNIEVILNRPGWGKKLSFKEAVQRLHYGR